MTDLQPDEPFIYPVIIEREISLFAYEAEALVRGELRRIIRPFPQSGVLDRMVVYTYGPHRLVLKKPWRNHFAQIGGEGDGTQEPLTLTQVQEAGLTEQEFSAWKSKFGPLNIMQTAVGAKEICWLATFEPIAAEEAA